MLVGINNGTLLFNLIFGDWLFGFESFYLLMLIGVLVMFVNLIYLLLLLVILFGLIINLFIIMLFWGGIL